MRGWWIIACLLFPVGGNAGVADRIARMAHPALARTESEIRQMHERLKELPELPFSATSTSLGFHTKPMNAEDEPVVLQLDLGSAYPIDHVALVPVGVPSRQGVENAYGFPAELQVEAALDVGSDDWLKVGQWKSRGGRYPALIELERTRARYVRVRITKHWPLAGQWVSALGEMMVFSGRRNVALHGPVKIIAGEALKIAPTWGLGRLTDGESLLGAPVNGTPSPSLGYRSGHTTSETWVQVDLGRSHRVDEIRLIPARHLAGTDTPGYGFPARFRVLAGYDAEFEEHQVLFDQFTLDFSNPGENPFVLPTDGRQFRYIRIVMQKPWISRGLEAFALSELQVYSGTNNVAFHASVRASHPTEEPHWSPENLTDGYSSRYRLVDRIDQLEMFAEREELELRVQELEARYQRQVSQTLSFLTFGGGSLVAVLTFTIFGLRWRHRRTAHRATQELRAQIAGDLHDDVGSNLGSIALLAQSGNGSTEKLREIEETARETAESMRDIVWMLKAGNSNTRELIRQMRAVAERGDGLEFDRSGERDEIELPLQFTRQVFLAFKEAIANARKHAQARCIKVRVEQTTGSFAFEVSDDGKGFDPQTPSAGNGLGNLRDRAGALGAELVIESALGQGTRIELRAPLPRS